jgi:hypothetical protein
MFLHQQGILDRLERTEPMVLMAQTVPMVLMAQTVILAQQVQLAQQAQLEQVVLLGTTDQKAIQLTAQLSAATI